MSGGNSSPRMERAMSDTAWYYSYNLYDNIINLVLCKISKRANTSRLYNLIFKGDLVEFLVNEAFLLFLLVDPEMSYYLHL